MEHELLISIILNFCKINNLTEYDKKVKCVDKILNCCITDEGKINQRKVYKTLQEITND